MSTGNERPRVGPNFLPVGDSKISLTEVQKVADLSLSADLVNRIIANSVVPPTTLGELIYEDTFTSQLSVDQAAALRIPFGDADAKYSRKIFIQEYLKYNDITDGDQKVRWGVGIRWVVNIQITDSQAKITSLPVVTASAQYGSIAASARFQVIGISSARVTPLVPTPASLSVDTYVDLKNAFDKIKALVWEKDTTISPQILAILGEVKDNSEGQYEESLAAGWALTKIKDGKTLQDAQNDHRSPRFDDVIKSVYVDVARTSDPLTKPNDDARAKARKILNDLSVED